MSFTRVNPPGWGTGADFTSAQGNQLDINVSNALDKTIAGDTLSGVIVVNSTGQIDAAFANNIVANATGACKSNVSGGIQSTVAGGIQATAIGGIVPTVAGGISDGGVVGGIKPTVSGGIQVTVAGGLQSLVAAGIISGVSGGIIPGVAGAIGDGGLPGGILIQGIGGITTSPGAPTNTCIVLGGSQEYVGYGTSRSFTRKFLLGVCGAVGMSLGTGWTNGAAGTAGGVTGSATSTVMVVPLNNMFSGQYNGAKLTSASIDFYVGASHASIAGMNFPTLTVASQSSVNNAGPTQTNLFQGTMSAGSGSAWYASGAAQTYAIPIVGSAATVDTSSKEYLLYLQDENGTNSAANNGYIALNLTFSNITNSAPG